MSEVVLALLGLGIAVAVFAARALRRSRGADRDGAGGPERSATGIVVGRTAQGAEDQPSRLRLREGERILLDETVTLLETRAYRVHGGLGTRIWGILIGGGVSESHQRLRAIDTGVLTLTTERLVFDGSRESRSCRLRDILSVSTQPDGIEVSTERRARSQMYRVADPARWTHGIGEQRGG